jgi:cysteine desulfurase
LEEEGFKLTYLGVDPFGLVSPEQVAGALREDTILVSVMHANNEIGTIEPIAEIARAVKATKPEVIFHTDAVQTVGHMEVNVRELGVDLLSFTAHKFYGPKGIGGLYARDGIQLEPQMVGGGQEHGRRSGTLSVPLIVGMAQALELACEESRGAQSLWSNLRDRLVHGLLSQIADSRLNGHPVERLPGNVNVSFLGTSGEDLVLRLDMKGIYASTGSACTTGRVDPSHVLTALGLSRGWALGGLRLTFGHGSREMEPEWVVEEVSDVVEELRSTSYVPSGASIRQQKPAKKAPRKILPQGSSNDESTPLSGDARSDALPRTVSIRR